MYIHYVEAECLRSIAQAEEAAAIALAAADPQGDVSALHPDTLEREEERRTLQWFGLA